MSDAEFIASRLVGIGEGINAVYTSSAFFLGIELYRKVYR
jgi:hypothetical protein